MAILRMATFNCENLFNRPKVFGQSKDRANALLGYAAELQAALREEVFDQDLIAALKKKLAGYVTVNDIRGKHDKAAGAADWVGHLELPAGPTRWPTSGTPLTSSVM